MDCSESENLESSIRRVAQEILRELSGNIEITGTTCIQGRIPVVPENPRATDPEEYKQNQRDLLEELDICPGSEFSFNRAIRGFNVSEYDEEQVLDIWYRPPDVGESEDEYQGGFPIVLFLHGGSIGGSAIGRSGYLPTLLAAGLKDSCVVAPDHRGSHSHLEKTHYRMIDRVVDGLISLGYAIDRLGDRWNGEVVIMGDSIGGHVASHMLGMFTKKEHRIATNGQVRGILVEPAAYTGLADYSPWVNFVVGDKGLNHLLGLNEDLGIAEEGEITKVMCDGDYYFVELYKIDKDSGEKIYRVSPYKEELEARVDYDLVLVDIQKDLGRAGISFSEQIRRYPPSVEEDSRSLIGLRSFATEGGSVLCIQMENDGVIPGGVAKLIRDVVKLCDKGTIMIMGGGGHGSTHPEEVKSIVKFVFGKDL